MTKPKDSSALKGDIEKAYPTVADDLGDGSDGQPMTVRLGELWSDFMRVADEARDPDTPKKRGAAVPLLDEMKGILQWD